MSRPAWLLLLTAWAGCGFAQASAAEIVRVAVGFDGQYKLGLLTPVDVTLRAGSAPLSGSLSVLVPDGDAVDTRYTTPAGEPLRLAAGQEAVVRLYVRFGQLQSRLTAEFSTGGQALCRRQFMADASGREGTFPVAREPQHRIYLVVGAADSLGLEELVRQVAPDEPADVAVVQWDDAGRLPDCWYGYEGLDAVVLCTTRPAAYAALTSDVRRGEALEQWVRMGGRLVLCVGASGEQVLQPAGPLARFAPGVWQKTALLSQASAWEAYCELSQPVPGVESGRELPVAQLELREGVVELREGDLPLVVRSARGFGRITLLATDPDRPPLSRWVGRLTLLERLLGLASSAKGEPQAAALPDSPYGVTDLTGQLNKALAEFTGVALVPFWIVAAAIAGYLLLVGPLDYFFLRRIVGRMILTWITFPLVVLGVSAAAYFSAYQLKGTQVRLNLAELIDVDVAGRMVRGTAWANLFSPRLDTYDLSARPAAAGTATDCQLLFSWLGQPGGALGGMSNRATFNPFSGRGYSFSPALDRLTNVPIQSWATKSFLARWQASAAVFPAATLIDEGPLLSGQITNRLSVPLRHAVLMYRNWAHELGDLAPGQSAPLGATVRRSQLQAYLLGEKVIRDTDSKFVQQTTPYDPASTDVATIVQAMMFYQAAGGFRYTGLDHGYQSYLDASGLLATDRAVLVAQVDSAGLDLLRDSAPLTVDRRTTFLRFVFPVEQRVSASRKPSP